MVDKRFLLLIPLNPQKVNPRNPLFLDFTPNCELQYSMVFH